ncbi:hypothetical protein, partial [Nostoc sp. NZL]|uniref:hypothetical protein n=1 Tax=Nostoc sp. NZL TaxID=2650612 RepID=UPI001E513FBE
MSIRGRGAGSREQGGRLDGACTPTNQEVLERRGLIPMFRSASRQLLETLRERGFLLLPLPPAP